MFYDGYGLSLQWRVALLRRAFPCSTFPCLVRKHKLKGRVGCTCGTGSGVAAKVSGATDALSMRADQEASVSFNGFPQDNGSRPCVS